MLQSEKANSPALEKGTPFLYYQAFKSLKNPPSTLTKRALGDSHAIPTAKAKSKKGSAEFKVGGVDDEATCFRRFSFPGAV